MAGTSPDGGAEERARSRARLSEAAPAATAKASAPAKPARRSAPVCPGRTAFGTAQGARGHCRLNAMDKTAIVLVVERVRHARYAKTVQRTKRLYAHDEANDVKVGDRVRLAETRPLSKLKRWRVEQVLERAR